MLFLILSVFTGVALFQADAHQNGCHRWHSCPSDTGSYTCGNTGYCSQCPDNQYCKAGKPIPVQSTTKTPITAEKPSTKTVNQTPACLGKALCTTDKVAQIIDGDTIYTKNYKIRLALTNTPEKNQKGFAEATAFTKKMCPVGSTISIDQDDKQKTDSYGRIVAKVTCSDKNLNLELLENKHGTILKQYCKKSEFASESWARKFGC